MKLSTFLFSALVTFTIFISTGYIACTKDECKDMACKNGGSCISGKCNCPAGYTGTNCEKYDPCAAVSCKNGGNCIDGKCNCPEGFEGKYCEAYEKDKFAGKWTVSETGTGAAQGDYELTVYTEAALTKIKIINLNDNHIITYGDVKDDSISFYSATTTLDSYMVKGSGKINEARDRIEVDYVFHNWANGNEKEIQSVWTK
jgi:hypothetical protein